MTVRHMIAGATLMLATAATGVSAEDFEVRMLNEGEDGQTMVFEPALLHIAPGDTVTFVPTDRGHNATSMEAMIPAGAGGWDGAISEPVSVTFVVEGTYGYICEPHYGLGMVGLVLVGDFERNFSDARDIRQRGQADHRFDELFEQAQALVD